MAKKKTKTSKSVATITHDEASRKNIPTAEFQSVMRDDELTPLRVAYERRNRDLDPQLVWRGKDEQDWSDLVVQAPPLYIQEKVHPKILVDDLRRQSEKSKAQEPAQQMDLFSDFNGLQGEAAKTEFYQHEGKWQNRMILGDSLQVMASLAEREGLRGKVQCIYLDPPYGIKFNSNFQWSTTSRDVKDGNAQHITREPEQVKAFRDTWRDGIHSYLTYLRDRLTVARDLLTDSGSIFLQIGDENVNKIRSLMDEIFGEDNFISMIVYVTSTGRTSRFIPNVNDYVLWYGKNTDVTKYRQLYVLREFDSDQEFELGDLTSQGAGGQDQPFVFQMSTFRPSSARHWSNEHTIGMPRLAKAGRIVRVSKAQIRAKKYFSDRLVSPTNNRWLDTQFGAFSKEKIYVVQTAMKVIQRCILMATDPGDLVLDPTCGSGTTAYVTEQWGRRWITIDTSRVALALARARIMGARYPYYMLADSKEGQEKEAELTRTPPSEAPAFGNIRQGFVYERVPHITLKSIANNAEIDVIWDQFQKELEPLREELNTALKQKWQEWEIPREAEKDWPARAVTLHKKWWDLLIARQKEIDASIAAKADFEYLYDKPYEDRKKVRVAGPFTVESLSPHRVLGVDADDELIDPLKTAQREENQDFARVILDNLKTAGVQQAHKEDKIVFTSLTPWPGRYICAEGWFEQSGECLVASGRKGNSGERLVDSDQTRNADPSQATHHKPLITQQKAAIFIGPEFGTVSRPDLVAAAREAGDGGFDVLITCAFNYDAHASDFNELGRIPVLKARMNADLHMADDLKNTGKGNLFVIFGEPDVEVVSGQWLVARDGRMVVNYEQCQALSGLGSLAEINRLGGSDLSRFKTLSRGREIRVDESASPGSGLSSGQHRRRSSKDGDRGVFAVSERGLGVAGRNGNLPDSGRAVELSIDGTGKEASGGMRGNQPHARWPQAVAAIQALRKDDFPLSLTTDHYTQVTLHGVDVFHPNTGEVKSDNADGIACWFIDTDYNEESFFVRHAYFLGANDPYKALKTTLKAEINKKAWDSLNSDVSRPFDRPKSGRIAVKVINHLGDEVMKVYHV